MIKNKIGLLTFCAVLSSGALSAETLVEAVKLGFENNYEYKSKIEDFNIDYAYKGLANSYVLPNLDLEGNVGYSNSRRDYNSKTEKDYNYDLNEAHALTLKLSQPIYNKQAWGYYNQGKLMAEKAQVTLDKDRNNLILKISEAYFNVLATQDDIEYSKAKVEYLKSYMNEISRKSEVGQSRKVDVEEVRAKYELATYEFMVITNNLKVQMDLLNKLLNQNITSFSKIKENLSAFDFSEKDMEIWKERSRQQNLDILATRLSVLLAEEDISISSSSYYPNLSLVGSLGINGGKDPAVDDKYNGRNASIGLVLSMNLYEGGATQNQRKQAEYKKNSADYMLKELENNIENLTTQYYLNVDTGLSQIDALEQSLISSEKTLESAQKSYYVGLKTTTDVLIATEAYFSAKRDYSKSKYSFLLSILSLKAVSGVISDEDVVMINDFLVQ